MSDRPFATAHISDIVERGGRAAVREHFGIEAFGVNAFTADEGADVISDHTEAVDAQEEIYLVTRGRARFTVAGEEVDAPAGTIVAVSAPEARRKAVAEEPSTTVVAVGAPRGRAYRVGPEFFPLYEAKDYEGAQQLLASAHERYPDDPMILYNLACMESLLGRRDDALEHLRGSVEKLPDMAEQARGDEDFAALRGDPEYEEIVAERPRRAADESATPAGDTHAAAHLDEVSQQPGAEGSTWIRIRKHFDLGAFGVNAYRANEAEGRVIEDHTEVGSAAGRHEELYYVLNGTARFTVAGEELEAPAGTFVFVRDPETRRGAVADEPETTVLVVGGRPGEPYDISPWDFMGDANLFFATKEYERAKKIIERGLERYPENASGLYNLACCESMTGKHEAAFEHLARSIELDPRFRDYARDDEDFAPIRSDTRFTSLVAG